MEPGQRNSLEVKGVLNPAAARGAEQKVYWACLWPDRYQELPATASGQGKETGIGESS
jgi:hypothetical protein